MTIDLLDFRARAMALACSGNFQSYAQIGAVLETEGLDGALYRLSLLASLQRELNAACDAARELAPD